jgi:hypothetical protein
LKSQESTLRGFSRKGTDRMTEAFVMNPSGQEFLLIWLKPLGSSYALRRKTVGGVFRTKW